AEMGVLLSMTEWLERDGIGMDIWFPAEIESARWEGDIYGLPMRTGGDANSLMFYNIDMLDQAGIGEVPTTWDELHAISRRLVRYDGDQLLQASISPHGGDLKSPAWLAAGGGLLYSADGKQVLFEGPEGLATATWLYDHFTTMYRGGLAELDGTFGTSQAKRRSAFINGQLAFNFEGSWNFSIIKNEAPDLNYGVALRPVREEGDPPGIHAGTFHYAVPQGVKDPELAWELVKWLTLNEETAGYFMFEQDRPSPVIAFSRNPAYWDENPYWSVVIEALTRVEPLAMYPFTYDVAVIFGDALRDSMSGDKAPQAALADAAVRAQALIDEYWAGKQ
ncbi:MAG: extracellular solute-binding protein, partial [Firmicutes bacterium]|nr:extracellular solute-binding protein [Bacillota bacterium]